MNSKLDIKSLKISTRKFLKRQARHASFVAILLVLLAYTLVVYKISKLANAEPSPDAVAATQTSIPKVDKKAIQQIQTLEQNNTEVHSLFNSARNNPFQE